MWKRVLYWLEITEQDPLLKCQTHGVVLNNFLTSSYKSVRYKNMFMRILAMLWSWLNLSKKKSNRPLEHTKGVLQNTNTIPDFITMNRWLSKGLFWYVPGVCWMFLRLFYLVFSTQLKKYAPSSSNWSEFPPIFSGWQFPKKYLSCHYL